MKGITLRLSSKLIQSNVIGFQIQKDITLRYVSNSLKQIGFQIHERHYVTLRLSFKLNKANRFGFQIHERHYVTVRLRFKLIKANVIGFQIHKRR